jgi:hypothetical protein
MSEEPSKEGGLMSEGGKPRTCVVVSYWTGRPPKRLHRLLAQMQQVDAGAPFDLLIVCNGGREQPLTLPARYESLRPRIINRENTGYNLGAWECGWRAADGYEFYLFLQDDCFLKRKDWVGRFEFRMSRDAGIGMLGESTEWRNQSWRYIREATDRDLRHLAWSEDGPEHPIDAYLGYMERRGIPRGECGTFLQSLILFTSRRVLEEIGGFPIMGSDYRAACACEVATSRLVESRGYRLSQIGFDSFEYIGHRQWKAGNRAHISMRWRLSVLRKRLLHGEGVGRELRRFLDELRTDTMPGWTASPDDPAAAPPKNGAG